MDRIRITGGQPLSGSIPIGGAKNAALPLMAASLLTAETLTLSNLPRLVDVSSMARLLAEFGHVTKWPSDLLLAEPDDRENPPLDFGVSQS